MTLTFHAGKEHYIRTSSCYSPVKWYLGASQVVLVIKNLPANAGNLRDTGLIPGSARSSGVGHGDLFQYSCL